MPSEYKIKVNVTSRPKGDEIELQPFGIVENGDSFTAVLTKNEAARYENNPHIDITATKRKKSDMNDDDLAVWNQAEALEEEEAAAEEARAAIAENTPVAGDESVAATEPAEGEGDN
jgi:hypothetical protein